MGAPEMTQTAKTVAVIGAGIVGVSTAIWLQRQGLRVDLIDRKAPGEGTSYGNAGLLAACAIVPVPSPGLWRKAPAMLLDRDQPLFVKWSYLPRAARWLLRYLREGRADRIAHRARAITQLISDTTNDHLSLSAGTGAERYVVPSDYLYAYENRAAFLADQDSWTLRRDNGYTWEELPREALASYDPNLGPNIGFGVRLGNHGRIIDPGAYVKALAQHAVDKGARLITSDVQDVVITEGRATGLRVGGETLTYDAIVVASGIWSGPLAKSLGLSVPLESERGYHIELWDPSITPRTSTMVAAGKFVMTPMEGRLRLAGVVEYGGLDAPPSKAPLELLKRQLSRALPDLTWSKMTEWMGHRPVISDSLPLIGAAPGVKGAYLGFGHDHLGLTAGPATGRLLAQMIAGHSPNFDMRPYDPARFT